jgi:hypothetical protein
MEGATCCAPVLMGQGRYTGMVVEDWAALRTLARVAMLGGWSRDVGPASGWQGRVTNVSTVHSQGCASFIEDDGRKTWLRDLGLGSVADFGQGHRLWSLGLCLLSMIDGGGSGGVRRTGDHVL